MDQLVLYSKGIEAEFVSRAITDVKVLLVPDARPSVPSLESDRAVLSISKEFSAP